MGVAVVVFLFVTGLIMAVYFAAFSTSAADRELNRRLKEVSSPSPSLTEAAGGDATVVKQAASGPLPILDRIVAQSRAGSGLERLIEQSGVKTTSSAIMTFSIGMAVGLGLLAAMFVRYPLVAPAIGAIGACMPFLWLRHKRKKRLKVFEEQFPEALDVLSRAIRAGHAFQTALGMAADEMPAPVGPELKKTFDQQNYAFALQQNSPLRKRINRALLALQERGAGTELKRKWFGEPR